MANPVVKITGGKRQLIPQLMKRVPETFKTYHEPFVGGGALFFHLQAQGRITKAVLSDKNERLVRTYRAIRENPDRVLRLVADYAIDKERFLEVRAGEPDGCSDAEVAAWYLYVNRCGYNGLYRVNKKGGCNVPYGTPKAPLLNDEAVQAASVALQCAEIIHEDFAGSARAERGDFVYFDPPYIPLSETANFTSYTADGFGMAEQVRLRDHIHALDDRGVYVVASNSDTPKTRELYGEFSISAIPARRAVNCRAERRDGVSEVLIS